MICAFCSVLFVGEKFLGAGHVTDHALRERSGRLTRPTVETDVNWPDRYPGYVYTRVQGHCHREIY
jgi:hypothetical protein